MLRASHRDAWRCGRDFSPMTGQLGTILSGYSAGLGLKNVRPKIGQTAPLLQCRRGRLDQPCTLGRFDGITHRLPFAYESFCTPLISR